MQTQMTKSQLIEKIAQLRELAKKDVKGMMEALAEVGYKELKKNGVFVVPGFAKFVVIKKPATKARKGVNPFNGRRDDVQGEARPKGCQGSAGQGRKDGGVKRRPPDRGPFAFGPLIVRGGVRGCR